MCKLHKSIYGLKQALHEWFKKLTKFLFYLGFINSKIDTSLFYKHVKIAPHFILVYVDDLLVISTDSHNIHLVITYLSSMFSMCDLGHAYYFLGIEILHTSSGCFLSQFKYITTIFKKYNMKNYKSVSNSCTI